MQFPRCIVHSLSSVIIYLLTIGVAILLLGMVPAVASAATPQLACAPTNLSFGQTVVGQTETLPVTLTNTGESSATISAVSANNSGFTPSSLSLPLTLAPGQSVELSVTFTPAARGWTGGTIKFISDATNSILPLQVSGAGVTSEIVTASPSTVTFGSSALGTVSTKPIVLTNARPWKVNLSALQTTGAGFSVSGPTFPYALDPGQSVTLNVDFSPSSAGPVAGILFISGAGLAIPLNGIGAAPGQLIANPASLSFGSVPAGSSATLMDSFTNTGGANVTISQATVAGTGFSVSGLSLPMVLFPGASVTFTAEFAPQGVGQRNGWHHCGFERIESDFECIAVWYQHCAGPAYPRADGAEFWQCNGGYERQSDQQYQRQRFQRDRFVCQPEQCRVLHDRHFVAGDDSRRTKRARHCNLCPTIFRYRQCRPLTYQQCCEYTLPGAQWGGHGTATAERLTFLDRR